jgi:hypothetical protein
MPPNRIKISGPVNGALALGAKSYDTRDLLVDGGRLLAEENEDFHLIDYRRSEGDTLQRYLFHYNLKKTSYEMSGEKLGFNLEGTTIGVSYGPFEFDNCKINLTIQSPVDGGVIAVSFNRDFMFYDLPSFRRTQVGEGYLDLNPALDLRNARIKLEASNRPLPSQELEVIQGDGGAWNRCSLEGITIYNNTWLSISGEIGVPQGVMTPLGGGYELAVTVTPVIKVLTSLVLAVDGVEASVTFPVLDFGLKEGLPLNTLAAWLYQANFTKIGIGFQLSRPVEGLQYSVKISDLNHSKEELIDGKKVTGKDGNENDYVDLVVQDCDLVVVDEGNVQKIGKMNATVAVGVPQGGELVLYDVSPDEAVSIEAVPSLIYAIECIYLNPAKIPFSQYALDAVDRFPAGTYPEAGEDAIDISEWTREIEKYVDPGKLRFEPEFYLYLAGHDGLLAGTRVKIDAKYTDRDSGKSLSVPLIASPGQDGYSTVNTTGVVPLFTESYTGDLPPSLVMFNTEKIISLLTSEQPSDLRIAYDFKLPDGRRLVNFDSEKENTVKAKVDLLVEIPLSLTILADEPGGDWATLRSYDVLSKEGDAFDRSGDGAPLAEGLKKVHEVHVKLNYENASGLSGIEADLVSRVSGTVNFRRPLGVLSAGEGGLETTVSGDELPFPFIPGFELRIPADRNGPDGNYAKLEINRNGSIRLEPEINVRAQVEQEFFF